MAIGGDDDSSSGVVVSGGGAVGIDIDIGGIDIDIDIGGIEISGGGCVEISGGSCGAGGPGLFRSRSLPHLLGNDSGVGGSFSDGGCPDGGSGGHGHGHGGRTRHRGGKPLTGGHCSKSQPAGLSGLGDVRQLVTLKQHYYPEGGWGWVVAAVAFTAHLLTHGLHLASGVFVQELVHKFGPGTVVPAVTDASEKTADNDGLPAADGQQQYGEGRPVAAAEDLGGSWSTVDDVTTASTVVHRASQAAAVQTSRSVPAVPDCLFVTAGLDGTRSFSPNDDRNSPWSLRDSWTEDTSVPSGVEANGGNARPLPPTGNGHDSGPAVRAAAATRVQADPPSEWWREKLHRPLSGSERPTTRRGPMLIFDHNGVHINRDLFSVVLPRKPRPGDAADGQISVVLRRPK